jgi:hypothetical protein
VTFDRRVVTVVRALVTYAMWLLRVDQRVVERKQRHAEAVCERADESPTASAKRDAISSVRWP